jgi:hypothetical protein
LSGLQLSEAAAKFGDCFAYSTAMPNGANQTRGNKMAKKTLKKSKKIEATKPLTVHAFSGVGKK